MWDIFNFIQAVNYVNLYDKIVKFKQMILNWKNWQIFVIYLKLIK